MMTLFEFVKNPALMEAWVAWKDSPFGKTLIDMLRTYARPMSVSGDKSGLAYAEAHGVQVGYDALLTLLARLDVVAESAGQAEKVSKMMPGDYGAAEFIKGLHEARQAIVKITDDAAKGE